MDGDCVLVCIIFSHEDNVLEPLIGTFKNVKYLETFCIASHKSHYQDESFFNYRFGSFLDELQKSFSDLPSIPNVLHTDRVGKQKKNHISTGKHHVFAFFIAAVFS